jgi:hypothetical protein
MDEIIAYSYLHDSTLGSVNIQSKEYEIQIYFLDTPKILIYDAL